MGSRLVLSDFALFKQSRSITVAKLTKHNVGESRSLHCTLGVTLSTSIWIWALKLRQRVAFVQLHPSKIWWLIIYSILGTNYIMQRIIWCCFFEVACPQNQTGVLQWTDLEWLREGFSFVCRKNTVDVFTMADSGSFFACTAIPKKHLEAVELANLSNLSQVYPSMTRRNAKRRSCCNSNNSIRRQRFSKQNIGSWKRKSLELAWVNCFPNLGQTKYVAISRQNGGSAVIVGRLLQREIQWSLARIAERF